MEIIPEKVLQLKKKEYLFLIFSYISCPKGPLTIHSSKNLQLCFCIGEINQPMYVSRQQLPLYKQWNVIAYQPTDRRNKCCNSRNPCFSVRTWELVDPVGRGQSCSEMNLPKLSDRQFTGFLRLTAHRSNERDPNTIWLAKWGIVGLILISYIWRLGF